MSAPLVGPNVITRAKDGGGSSVHSASFIFHIKRLADIANEFGVERSSEKGATIKRGVEAHARADIAERLRDRTFLIDRAGRELPLCVGSFDAETIDVVRDFHPNPQNEMFEEDLVGTTLEATRYKLWLKSVLQFARLIHVDEKDDNLMLFRIDTEPTAGEGTVDALFRAGGEEKPIYVSVTEVTNFNLAEEV